MRVVEINLGNSGSRAEKPAGMMRTWIYDVLNGRRRLRYLVDADGYRVCTHGCLRAQVSSSTINMPSGDDVMKLGQDVGRTLIVRRI